MGCLILQSSQFRHYIEAFNREDQELYPRYVPNRDAWDFLSRNIPLFDCPDKELELTYYFRWWTYRKHIKQTPQGFVITEFLPDVSWARKYNTINLTAPVHVNEGRWLCDRRFIKAYTHFWWRQGGTISGPGAYANWLPHALWECAKAFGDVDALTEYLAEMADNYHAWQRGWEIPGFGPAEGGAYRTGLHPNGLFFQGDNYEGTEYSISGYGYRPLTNSGMCANAAAIAAVARQAGNGQLEEEFRIESERLRKLIHRQLWNEELEFFCTRTPADQLAPVRELCGYAPWYFGVADDGYEAGWSQIRDPEGFAAPYGPTFPEQRHGGFQLSYEGHECQWNGPSWPLTTSITLTAMANLLNDYPKATISARDYFDTLLCYARSHRRVREDGTLLPWIDENLHPYTGDWIARSRYRPIWSVDGINVERGKDYNHSTFCDLIITGLIGLRPRVDSVIEVNPLIPHNAWDYFCLERIPYHDGHLTILWDRNGSRYGRGPGLQLFRDGVLIATRPTLGKIQAMK
ncbi:MAG: hypothetical protein IT447_07800 [Phycisphaerales bacterium]|jgi:hypothetical protein|nr:hypothetical protein [Phycisphaerales bacterium]